MRNCFICTTPYQILAVMSMIKDFKKDCDLYIVNQFDGAEVLSSRLREENIFREVVLVDERQLLKKYHRDGNKILVRMGVIRAYVDIDKIVTQFLKNETEYDHLFMSSNGMIAQLTLLYLHKHYNLSLYSYFDDGIGIYCNDDLLKISTTIRLCRRLLIDRTAGKLKNHDIYVYNKKLYQLMHKDSDDIVHEFKFMELNNENIESVCHIFDLKTLPSVNEKVIVMDSIRENELTTKGIKQLTDIFDMIAETIGEKEVIFKAHPRDKKTRTSYKCLTSEGDVNLPFELYGLAQDLSDKVLITNMSTAVFSPKLVLDQEPTIILLFKILESQLLNKTKIDEVVGYFKKIYSDSSKIYVPETEEELKNILENVV